MTTRLTDKQRLFVAEYLVDLNAAAAARRAGYSEKTSRKIGQENLTKPDIQRAISEGAESLLKRTDVTAERVLEEYARLGFSNMQQFVSWDGSGVTWKDSEDLDEGAAACISEVSETISEGGRTRRFKLHSKTQALDKLSQYVELVKPEAGPGTTVNVNVNLKQEEERAKDVLSLHEQIAAYRKGYEDAERDTIPENPARFDVSDAGRGS